ncbi:Cd2 antigen cytoplasmic tail-binding protein 2 [Plakobranchus ocellatus]|uniref:Cd2 antigen cytoplasmic tail-binding protein 2 n=1 Tax=Plakobranchus ocellatus TaxID=259542 RepID=A0AAV3ZXP9_9GAST|nr:Cd2 antigen cytoplasmic tail-binding protein 2 [Plakobranchus ocellatus]
MAETEENLDEKATRFKEKHSLDSDEEDDDGKKYDVLADDDIEGQEEATIEFDEETPIMPFNMREEMEEGHFDAEGTYIFDKTKEIRDNWIDNIDWVKVKHTNPDDANTGTKRPFEGSDSSDEEEDEDTKNANMLKLYESILDILEKGETVAKAIRRLCKNKAKIPSASQRWKAKKKKTTNSETSGEEDQEAVNKAIAEQKQMLRLTELCDLLIQKGIMDIYETSYERISFTIKQMQEKAENSRLTIAEKGDDGNLLDMFADDFDEKDESKANQKSGKDPNNKANTSAVEFKKPAPPSDSTKSDAAVPGMEKVLWEYKENLDSAEIKGPFTTSQMSKWADDGSFGSGVLCRKYQSEGQFYNSSRLDFELYDE